MGENTSRRVMVGICSSDWVEGHRFTTPQVSGQLVLELVYEYLDLDVAEWLRQNAPAPRHGQNYHQWLSAQYGLRKLVEHIWMLIGVARTCETMMELRDRMAALNGKQPVQLRMYLPMPGIETIEPPVKRRKV